MILIAGIPGEAPTKLILQSAKKAEVPFVFLNQHKFHQAAFNFKLSNGGSKAYLNYDGRLIDLNTVKGVYYRFIESGDYATSAASGLLNNLYAFNQWLEVANCRVMNRSSVQVSNSSKPYQCQLIHQAGLATPPTFITNNIERVRVYKKETGALIFKSISSIRSIVKELDAVKMLELDRIRFLPVQFQPLLKGVNVRVHIAGNQIFAALINSTAVDYRYARREELSCEIESIQLPEEIQRRCFKLAEMLKMPLCGIDLFQTPEEIFCFEVNPSPGYSYYQEQTDDDISGAIVSYLCGNG